MMGLHQLYEAIFGPSKAAGGGDIEEESKRLRTQTRHLEATCRNVTARLARMEKANPNGVTDD